MAAKDKAPAKKAPAKRKAAAPAVSRSQFEALRDRVERIEVAIRSGLNISLD